MEDRHFGGVKRQTDNKFLNMYEIDGIKRNGTHFPYYFASRRSDDDIMCVSHEVYPEGVVIYPVMKNDPEKIVLLRQYRYPEGQYIYELPAGLVEKNEDLYTAAVREMHEETGLKFTPFTDYPDFLKKAAVQNQGMCDECDATVFGYAEGVISEENIEDSEDIQAFTADRKKVREIMEKGVLSVRALYLLTMFLKADPENPFEFLKV